MTITTMTTAARRLGGSDTFITPIALGAMLMGTATPEPEARRILEHFIGEVAPRYRTSDGDQALAMIDTADCYCWWSAPGETGGHSEQVLGRFFTASGARQSVLLSTKGTALIDDVAAVWEGDRQRPWDVVASHFVGASAPVLRRSLADSLERLGTDHVDLYYVHVDDRRTPLEETLETLAAFVADGVIGAYGWSNVRTWRLAQILALCDRYGWPEPLALQQQHSYLRRRAGLDHASIVDDEQSDFLAAHPGLQLIAYSPVLKGVYSDRSKRADREGILQPYRGEDAQARFAAIDDVARQLGATGNQVALAWLLAQSSPTVVPLIGPRTWDQYRECIDALDVDLSADHRARLDSAGA